MVKLIIFINNPISKFFAKKQKRKKTYRKWNSKKMIVEEIKKMLKNYKM